jgi:hypothetical protein
MTQEGAWPRGGLDRGGDEAGGTAVGKPFVGHRSQERIRFRLDRLRQKSPRPVTQNRCQGIVERVGTLKWVNSAIRSHRRIAPFGRFWQALPASIRRLHQTVITHIPP